MSMHLLPAYWTTTNTKKRKQKRSKKQQATDTAHAKYLRKMGYTGSTIQAKKYNPKTLDNCSEIKSLNSDRLYDAGSARKSPNVYSGNRKLLGIATMHKSNMVPVFSEDDAEAISKMRR